MPGPYRCIRIITRPLKNRLLYRLPPKEDHHVHITRGIYHYAYAQQTQVKWKKKTSKEEKGRKWVHGAKERKMLKKNCGVYWRVCHQNMMPRGFSTVYSSTNYKRLSIHPPKHGLPANYAIDSWSWLSRTCLCIGSPGALPLVGSCLGKTCGVLDGLTVAAHQNQNSYDVSFLRRKRTIFFSINMKIKRLLYMGQSDACTTKLANGTRTAL